MKKIESQLIKHLLTENIEDILSKSYMNCHAIGLHSVMLLDCPGKTIRMFITDENHNLHKNYASVGNPKTLAFHPHHCNLTLHCIYGSFVNWIVEEDHEDGLLYKKWLYDSAIVGGGSGFQQHGITYLKTTSVTGVEEGQSVFMTASDIHTVSCPKETVNAWIVYEGLEDPNYSPISYSNMDLTLVDNAGLYQKPTNEDILFLLHSCNAI